MLGYAPWSAYVTGRGGSPTRYELAYESLSVSKVLNSAGQGRVTVPNTASAGSTCCEVFNGTEPWKDEVAFYRGQDLAYVGPLLDVSASPSGGELFSQDLFIWMEQRFIESNFHGGGDVADIFNAIFDVAYEKDPSPNISISTRHSGIEAVRDFKGDEFHRAADVMRELARTGLDFTMDGRRILAGGLEVFLSVSDLILHDEGVVSAEVSREGGSFATDVAVFGATENAGGHPVTGRAIRASERYGLIQRSFTELLIKDRLSADANAEARVLAMQPAPLRLKVTLSPDAAFEFGDLIPGRRVDVRLRDSVGCIEVIDVMRLQQVDISVSNSDSGVTETIELQLIPLGVSEDA